MNNKRTNCQFRVPKSVTRVSQQDRNHQLHDREFIKKSSADSLTITRYHKKEQLQSS